MRELRGGGTQKVRFRSLESVETLELDAGVSYEFLYEQGDTAHFMQMESFEELELGVGLLGDDARWLQEGMSVHVQRYENEPIAVTLPTRAAYHVSELAGGAKEGKSDNSRQCVLSNGVRLRVPHFISLDDRVIVDIQKGEYVGKAQGTEYE